MMKRCSGSSSPVECRPFTNVAFALDARQSAAAPMRVMMRMLATTYGLSVISTPQRDERRIDRAHAVRDDVHRAPAHAPSNSASIFACASAGAIQWLFGPASSLLGVQTKVRCSTRATSDGCERCS